MELKAGECPVCARVVTRTEQVAEGVGRVVGVVVFVAAMIVAALGLVWLIVRLLEAILR
jgi:hypothetical protein